MLPISMPRHSRKSASKCGPRCARFSGIRMFRGNLTTSLREGLCGFARFPRTGSGGAGIRESSSLCTELDFGFLARRGGKPM
jgi:hypothetical protein